MISSPVICGRKITRKLERSGKSEACVERAFLKHKLVHINLNASLSAEKLDDQLFVRYNLKKNTLKNAYDVEIANDVAILSFDDCD